MQYCNIECMIIEKKVVPLQQTKRMYNYELHKSTSRTDLQGTD